MTNQTQVFSIQGAAGSGVADVTALANHFIRDGITQGLSGFCIRQVVVTPADASFARNWYTLQVDYYDPGVM